MQKFSHETFGNTDFKYVDNLPENQMLKGLKVGVNEIPTNWLAAASIPCTHILPIYRCMHVHIMGTSFSFCGKLRSYCKTIINFYCYALPGVASDGDSDVWVRKPSGAAGH